MGSGVTVGSAALGTAAAGKRAGRFALLRQLVADGVTCLFGNPGSSEQNLLEALRDDEFRSVTYYLALHEGTAVAMADSYARARQQAAVVQLHSYAGLANGLGMVKYAHRGCTPLVVLVGEAGLRYEALDGQMAADLIGMASTCVKSDNNGPCAWRAVDSGSLLRLLRRALKTSMTPPRGPVLLALPMDVLEQPNTEPVVRTSYIRTAVRPDAGTLAEAARLLAAAEEPLLLIGDGIAAAHAQAELTEVAELLGAVVWGANDSEVNMPASHALFGGRLGHMFGAASRPLTTHADGVLICGTTVLPEVFPEIQPIFHEQARVIHFDLNPTELAKNCPVTIAAVADPKPTLAALARELRLIMTPEQQRRAQAHLRQHAAAKQDAQREARARDAAVRDEVPMHATRFMEELARRLPARSLIFDEALTYSEELTRYLPQEEPGAYFQTRAGMLGTGLPGALGLKVAHPDRRVFGFSGDGGSMSTLQALATAARHRLGCTFVVCNNRSYRILKYNLRQYRQDLGLPPDQPFPEAFDLALPEIRFDLLAEGMGVAAARVAQPGEIAPAIDRALADDQPFLIDLVLSSAL